MVSLRSFIKHLKECFIGHLNTLKLSEKNSVVFLFLKATSRRLEFQMKHFSSCLLYYMHNYLLILLVKRLYRMLSGGQTDYVSYFN